MSMWMGLQKLVCGTFERANCNVEKSVERERKGVKEVTVWDFLLSMVFGLGVVVIAILLSYWIQCLCTDIHEWWTSFKKE